PVGRAARAEGSSDAETPHPPGVRHVGTSPGLGDAPRWRSSLLDQRGQDPAMSAYLVLDFLLV
ncbi:hypothetical protein QWJ41_14090, partial [Nocardioides sp. SOB44]